VDDKRRKLYGDYIKYDTIVSFAGWWMEINSMIVLIGIAEGAFEIKISLFSRHSY